MMPDNNLNSTEEQLEQLRKELMEVDNKIQTMDRVRAERLSEVSEDNSNDEAQARLIEVESELEQVKDKRKELEKLTAKIKQDYKLQKMQEVNKKEEVIQQKLSEAIEERDRLRSDIIPAAKRKLEEHEKRKKELDITVLNLSNELSNLHRNHETEQDQRDSYKKFS
jgi:chromosome segregation ATPase